MSSIGTNGLRAEIHRQAGKVENTERYTEILFGYVDNRQIKKNTEYCQPYPLIMQARSAQPCSGLGLVEKGKQDTTTRVIYCLN